MLVNALVLNWKAKLAVGTVYNRVTHLRKILRILETYGAPPCAATLPNVKRTPPRTNIFDPQQIAAIISGSPAWLKLFTVLAWQLALRFSETFAVTPRSHNAEQQTITISTKGGKVRTIPTTPDVENLIAACGDTTGREDDPYICILHGESITPRGLRFAWYRECERAGATGLRPHDLRRTTATALYRSTKDLRAVQQYLGHDDLASTTHYLAPLQAEELRGLQQLLNFHSRVKQ